MGVDWAECNSCRECYNDWGDNYPKIVNINGEDCSICPNCWTEDFEHKVVPVCTWKMILFRFHVGKKLQYILLESENIMAELTNMVRMISYDSKTKKNTRSIQWVVVHDGNSHILSDEQLDDNLHVCFERLYVFLTGNEPSYKYDLKLKENQKNNKFDIQSFDILKRTKLKSRIRDEKDYYGHVSSLGALVNDVREKFRTMVKRDPIWNEYHYVTKRVGKNVLNEVKKIEEKLDKLTDKMKTMTHYSTHTKVTNAILQSVPEYAQGTFINVCIPTILVYLYGISMYNMPRYLPDTRQSMGHFVEHQNKRKRSQDDAVLDSDRPLKRVKDSLFSIM